MSFAVQRRYPFFHERQPAVRRACCCCICLLLVASLRMVLSKVWKHLAFSLALPPPPTDLLAGSCGCCCCCVWAKMAKLRAHFVLFGDSITQHSFANEGWGAALADLYSRKVGFISSVFDVPTLSFSFFLLSLTLPFVSFSVVPMCGRGMV